MLEQKFNFPVEDLILIYHLMPNSLCVAIKLWMVCVFEFVTISAIFIKLRFPEFHQWLVSEHSATMVSDNKTARQELCFIFFSANIASHSTAEGPWLGQTE